MPDSVGHATGGRQPSVELCIASFNTRAATELTVRSAVRRAGTDFRLVVGDGGSTDGSVPLLMRMESAGTLRLERSAGPRMHKDWLDLWYATSSADYLVFADSDVYFRREGWLRALIETSRTTGAALVAGRIQPDWTQRPAWAAGTARTLPGERPEPALLLLDMAQLRGVVTASFAYHEEWIADRPGHKLGLDVGGNFLREVRSCGLTAVAMPTEFAAFYHHWGGLTWKHASDDGLDPRVRARQLGKAGLLQALVWRERSRRA